MDVLERFNGAHNSEACENVVLSNLLHTCYQPLEMKLGYILLTQYNSSVSGENLVSTWTVFCKANLRTETPNIFF